MEWSLVGSLSRVRVFPRAQSGITSGCNTQCTFRSQRDVTFPQAFLAADGPTHTTVFILHIEASPLYKKYQVSTVGFKMDTSVFWASKMFIRPVFFATTTPTPPKKHVTICLIYKTEKKNPQQQKEVRHLAARAQQHARPRSTRPVLRCLPPCVHPCPPHRPPHKPTTRTSQSSLHIPHPC